ncbi:ribonuclease J [Brachyspira aalborgi]|jgi:ribonuclease J|uniref:Ribonuclease J n=2 Tax=Brachyspira aalborgi TaxID=29522 RepID=A0A5C8CGT4_9SPIR|nr:ribonuclease J [Brachyspira aalborgi]TXJ12694.1 ribonuclease J [Brachyspira aalborgi]TXJ16699.1 ribonuclease J [Brachyspira aalborgi]TXJ20314.1 ribonuclease J [Brachyspira aalborgi]TXJ22109.1 ribonuclease J [Brachyspira aalborgi]TXJ26860.1 ribonuclease J [Brachyspira aalborgi]
MNDNNDKIRIIPLGGVQEIGMNMTVIEYGNELIIIDCGFMFPRYHMLGIDYVIPDTSYLKDKNIIGLILTHGHEDHIGAIPHFLRNFPNIKIYGTRLTAAFLKAKLSDYKNEYKDIEIYELEPRNKIKLGINFEIEFIRVNHSIPDGVGVAIKTPLGIIIHTGDFKIDLNPTTDRFIDLYKFAEYGEKGVLLLLADSTNCQREGFSISESVVQSTIIPLFAYKDGMIIAAVFASSIERIQDLVTAAKVNNKYITFSGRSLIKYTKIAEEMGYLNLYDIVIPIDKINRYPREKIVCLTTGTQGEPYSSLSLIAAGSHRHIKIEDGDMVIFSSSIIPGNEMVVTRMINNLFDLGAKMVGEDKKLLHVSGHASSEDLKLMYRLVKPKYFIPIHGEKRHLISHINLVENLNGLNTKGFLLYNGNVLEIDKNLDAKLSEPIEIRNIYVDGKGVGDLEESIFHDREQLSLNGVVAANVIIKKNINGNYDIKIDTESKGFIYKSGDNESLLLKTEELKKEGINSAMESVKKLLSKNKKTPSTIKYEVREALRRKYMQIIGREPVIFVSLYIDDIIEENKEQLK